MANRAGFARRLFVVWAKLLAETKAATWSRLWGANCQMLSSSFGAFSLLLPLLLLAPFNSSWQPAARSAILRAFGSLYRGGSVCVAD